VQVKAAGGDKALSRWK